MKVEFVHGVAFPQENGKAYREVFALEVRLRRLARLALSAVGGPSTTGTIPPELVSELKQRRATTAGLEYLGVQSPDDLLALTTLDELRRVLIADHVFPTVRRLTGFPRELLDSKLTEIRDIRNAIGHNRVASGTTSQILEAAVLSLQHGFARLSRSLLAGPERHTGGLPISDAAVNEHFEQALTSRTGAVIPEARIAVAQQDAFYCGYLIPRHLADASTEEPAVLGEWLDIQVLLVHLDDALPACCGILIPSRATSFELLWPQKASLTAHAQVIRAFIHALDTAWGDEPYPSQDQALFTHPQLWLVEDLNGPAPQALKIRS